MRTIILFLTLIIMSVFTACGGKEKSSTKFDIIKLDFTNAKNKFDLSEWLNNDVRIVPLETTDESLVAEMSDIRITDHAIYIIDLMAERISVFDLDGRFLRNIGEKGRGPNEYLDMTCAEIMGDSLIAIFDKLQIRLFYFNNDGTFKRSCDVSQLWAHDIVEMDGSLYFINSSSETERGYYHLFNMDIKSGNTEPLLPFNKKISDESWSGESYHTKNNNELMVYFAPYDTLYLKKHGEDISRYFVDFGKRKIPRSVIKQGPYISLSEINSKSYISGVRYAFLSNKYLIVSFKEKDDYFGIYDRLNKTSEVYREMFDPRFPQLPYYPECIHIRDGILVSSLSSTGVKRVFSENDYYKNKTSLDTDFEREMVALGNSRSEFDNPVLFIQTIKQ